MYYGQTVHDNCERRSHFDAGRFVEKFGSKEEALNYCLYKMGCKGPVTFQNCPNVRWNEGTNWPIGCGHPCIGCAEPDFWDKMTPFYAHLQGVPGFGVTSNVDKVGFWATVGVGAAFAAHGFMSLGKRWWQAERLIRFLTPGTASPTPRAPVGFGAAAGRPPKVAQVPMAIVDESAKIPFGATASLCFTEKGKFEYVYKSSATFYPLSEKEHKGIIWIQ